jgi:hypothetical protein
MSIIPANKEEEDVRGKEKFENLPFLSFCRNVTVGSQSQEKREEWAVKIPTA